MERLVALGAVLAFVSLCQTSPQKGVKVVVDDGRLGIGLITGGSFGPGSFSIGGSGGSRPAQTHVYVNEDDGNVEQIIIQNPSHHRGQQDNRPPHRDNVEPNNSGGGNTQLYPVKPQTIHIISGQGGMGDEGGTGGSQIYIDTVILPNNKNNEGNKKKNGNKQPVPSDASAIEAIFGSNGGNNSFPSAGNGFASTSSQGSIQIDSIAGANFAEGTGSLNNNKISGANVPQKESTVNNGNTEYSNAGNEAFYSVGHGANNNGTGNGYNHGQINSGHNSGSSEEPWIWSR